jgi:hypothetical protein
LVLVQFLEAKVVSNASTTAVSVVFSNPSLAIRSYPVMAAVFLMPANRNEHPLLLCGRANDPRAVQRAACLAEVLAEMPDMFGGTIAAGYVAGRHIAWDRYSIAFILADKAALLTHGKILALMRNTDSQARMTADQICASQAAVAAMMVAL